MKKTTRKTKAASQARAVKSSATAATPPPSESVARAVSEPTVQMPTTTPVGPVTVPRRNLTPAAKLGAATVRFLRIHRKRPYGLKGEQAIVAMAVEAAHLARVELGDTARDEGAERG